MIEITGREVVFSVRLMREPVTSTSSTISSAFSSSAQAIGTAVNAVARPIDPMAAASGFTVKFFNRLSTKFHRFAKNLRQPLIYFWYTKSAKTGGGFSSRARK